MNLQITFLFHLSLITPHILNTPNSVLPIGAFKHALIASANTLHVSSGSRMPSSHRRARDDEQNAPRHTSLLCYAARDSALRMFKQYLHFHNCRSAVGYGIGFVDFKGLVAKTCAKCRVAD